MNERFEIWYPYLFSLIGAGTLGSLLYFSGSTQLPGSTKDLYAAVINITAIAVGFLAMAKSILLSIDESRAMRMLRQAGKYALLIDYSMTAVRWCFITAILTAAWIILQDYFKDLPLVLVIGFVSWAFFSLTAALTCYRVLHVFAKILQSS